ncbi:MAG: murein biosynthesis integral rane protein MurJ [Xanthobacteraceae bacterium]|jgi:putative peptidoglycan lipid II flippase|nr:murein biosynthesis integral rane protein MurJ [Xanthobacteraceae bacterium]
MSLARNMATVGTATLLSRLLGFARDMMIAGVFGTGARADAFFVSFQFANLARRLLAEGGLNAALVPLYLRARDQNGEAGAARFAGRLLGTLTLCTLIIGCLAALAMPILILLLAPGFATGGERLPIAVELGRLMLPYIVTAGPLAVLIGILNANHRFVAAAFATTEFNMILLVALAVIYAGGAQDNSGSGMLLAGAVGVTGLIQLLLLGLAVWRTRTRVTPLGVSFDPQVRQFFALAIPGLLAGGIPQIVVMAGVMVASISEGAVSWIYYANRLIELPLGIVGIAVGTVLVPAFSHAVRSGNRDELSAVESRGLELALGLSLPAAFALAILAKPIVGALFQRGAFTTADTAATALALAVFALGLPGHVLVKAFSPVFFAREDTKTPMHAALVGLAVAVIGSVTLLPFAGHAGVAAAIALSGWAGALFLGWRIRQHIGFALDNDAKRRLPRIALAALIMATALAAAHQAMAPWLAPPGPTTLRLAALAALIGGGLALYGGLLQAFGVIRLRELARFAR